MTEKTTTNSRVARANYRRPKAIAYEFFRSRFCKKCGIALSKQEHDEIRCRNSGRSSRGLKPRLSLLKFSDGNSRRAVELLFQDRSTRRTDAGTPEDCRAKTPGTATRAVATCSKCHTQAPLAEARTAPSCPLGDRGVPVPVSCSRTRSSKPRFNSFDVDGGLAQSSI